MISKIMMMNHEIPLWGITVKIWSDLILTLVIAENIFINQGS